MQKTSPGDGVTVAPPALRDWPPDVAQVAPGWRPLLKDFLRGAEGRRVAAQLQAELATGTTVFPPEPLRALRLTAPQDVRVVILGQDPYHGPGQANGLAFAVAPGVKPPPSLRNIFKELTRDFGRPPAFTDRLLDHWARQGVLLLNTSLTVRDGAAASHATLGWSGLTDAIVHALAQGDRSLAFLLWGAHAQAKARLVVGEPAGHAVRRARHPVARAPRAPHLVLAANHPSPLSALRPPVPFIGCGHFARANDFLRARGQPPIDWLGEDCPQGPTPLAGPGQLVA